MPDTQLSAVPDRWDMVADVAVVGAGVAGLYCAWRLLSADPARRVVVLDRLPRVGGRLDTDLVRLQALDRLDEDGQRIAGAAVVVKEEEGGMRFNAAMPELLATIEALGMWPDVVPFGMGDDENLFHVRGRSFSAGASKLQDHALWGTLYDLRPHERNKSPGEIVLAVYRDLAMANGELPPEKPTPEYWQRFRLDFSFQGRGLNEWGFWSLLRAMGLSDECITMLSDTVGFQAPFLGQSNAGCAMQLLEDFPLDPRFFALRYGFGSLPQALRGEVERLGGQVRLSTRVEALERAPGDEGVILRLGQGGGDGLLEGGGESEAESEAGRLVARQVVLAVPSLALRRLEATSPMLRAAPAAARLAAAHAGVIEHTLCKVNLYYSHAWWRDHSEGVRPQVRNGGCFSTQPLGAVYVFDPLASEDANGPAALTIYCDFVKTEFWRQLQEIGPKFASSEQRAHDAERPQVLFAASEALVAEATAQLRDLFHMLALPRPVLTSYRLWGGDNEFGYAYHQWARGADDRAIMRDLAQPCECVFVCNEAFSDDQGWVNGSLRSADRVLQGWFGVGPLPPARGLLPGSLPTSAPVRSGRKRARGSGEAGPAAAPAQEAASASG